MSNREARVIAERDRARIWRELARRSERGDFAALRLRAVATLCVDTGLRLAEVIALNLEQLVEDTAARAPRFASSFVLRREQSKRKERGALIQVPKSTRQALRAYVLEAHRREWITGPPWRGPLLVTMKGPQVGHHQRPSDRAIQKGWQSWQRSIGIVDPYRFHDMRHTAITRWSEETTDPYVVAQLARHRDIRTTSDYVHRSPARLAELAERASRK